MNGCRAASPALAATFHEVRPALTLGPGVIAAGLVILGAVLRFAFLGQKSLWADEAFVVWVIRHPWPAILPVLRAGDAHPPLYYLLIKAWSDIAGIGEWALRVPSAVASTLTVMLTYCLMRRFSSTTTSLLAAGLVSVSPFHIMAGQEARMYGLLSALAVGSTLALVASIEEGGLPRWATYVAAAALMVYTHHLGIFILAAHGLWVACCERPHLGRWLGAGALVAMLYAPWIPAVWQQTATVHALLPVGRSPKALMLGDLLGLYAFGGSLFGMGSYFFPGARQPIEQAIVLWPFLALVCRGAISMASNRRALVLLGVPLVLSIGAMLIAPGTHPRGFSHLVPFYAAFLAWGLVDVAGRIEGRRDRIVGFLLLGLLLYNVPALQQHYLDPESRPFRWRAAAAFVEAQVRPGDFFLYVGRPAGMTFTYYFHAPHPSLALTPLEWVPRRGRPTFADVEARRLAERAPRVWLVMTVPLTPANPIIRLRLLPALMTSFHEVTSREFGGVWVTLLQATRVR